MSSPNSEETLVSQTLNVPEEYRRNEEEHNAKPHICPFIPDSKFNFAGMSPTTTFIGSNLRPSSLSHLPRRNVSETLDRLREIRLLHHPNEWPEKISDPIVAFENAPSLREVLLSRPFLVSAGQNMLKIPWTQLTKISEIFDNERHSVNTDANLVLSDFFNHCLPLCKSLEELSIHPGPFDGGDTGNCLTWIKLSISQRKTMFPPFVLQNLRRLAFQIRYTPEEKQFPDLRFLGRFRFPGIEEFCVDACGNLESPGDKHTARTLRRAFPNSVPLLILRVSCSTVKGSRNLSRMLGGLPRTRKVWVQMPVHEAFFAALFKPRREGNVLVLRELGGLRFTNWGEEGTAEAERVQAGFRSESFARFMRAWLATPSAGGVAKTVSLFQPPRDVLRAFDTYQGEEVDVHVVS